MHELFKREHPLIDLLVTHRVIEGDGPDIVRQIDMRFGLGIKGVNITIINLRPQ